MRLSRAKKCILAAAVLLILTFSGCLNDRMDELFTLPRPSQEYLNLQDAIDGVLATGMVYSAPAGGSNRQSVQLWDFDGNGVSEAVAFFSGTGDNPLKLYVFKKNSDDVYVPALILEGEGTGFASVDYSDLDGDGWLEIVISRRISSELRMLRVYSVRDFLPTPLTTADYSEYEHGRRATGLVYSAGSFATKFGGGIAGAIIGMVLAKYGYVGTDAATIPGAIPGIKLLMGYIPSAIVVVTAVLMILYPLSDRRLSEITAELAKRRAN